MALSILGCGGKPSKMDQITYDCGTEAAEVTQGYIDGKITQEAAHTKLSTLYAKLDAHTPKDAESSKYTLVSTYVLILTVDLDTVSSPVPNKTTLQDHLDELNTNLK